MESRWIVKQQGDIEVVRELMEVLSVDFNIATLLAQRNITTFEEAKKFFRPDFEQLHDPYLMKDMDKAVERVLRAIEKSEKVLIYGDYDVDGTTSVALVYSYLKKYFKKRIEFYIPDRYEEGYGISYKGIDHAADNGFNLVIALDCGIKAVEKIKYANERNVDFIICDHHRPGDVLPDAVAVLDAKRLDCTYPFKELSGCGVGFKLISALASEQNEAFDTLLQYLDLVAISIAADIVPITGENRFLAYYGLKLINSAPRPGLESVLRYSQVLRRETQTDQLPLAFNKELSISDLVFLIGPRINAAGRIESACDSVRLLLADKMSHSDKLAHAINDLNTERRSLDNQITEEALAMIENNNDQKDAKSTVLFNENWHKGVIGIVASRLTDTYYRPTIILTRSNNLITGSARSIKHFDVYDAIDHCSDLLEHFGGHKYAAGLSLKIENLELFKKKFNDFVSNTIKDEILVPEIEIDTYLNFSDITPKFMRILKQFAPFGPGNLSPVFRTDNIIDSGRSRIVGKNHLKLELIQIDSRSEPFSGIAFQKGDKYDAIKSGVPFSICYHLEENEWQGKTNLQLNVKDIKPNYE
ncbi:MAG: single-stranded-DNA-specific exonuclease RecJ [Bacteroidales bacterium]|nr:single-stranded-DNA-specific exonuclease RecJ [Bacteroidales bacterium]MDP2236914.1 single-stranded-DNA-specific exonuclease RecJ [Bacteroidales bacterium]